MRPIIKAPEGLLLEYADGRKPITALIEIQKILNRFGTGLWPINLQNTPQELKHLLKNTVLSDAESDKIQKYFQLSKEDLVKTITDAGRKPHLLEGEHTSFLFITKENEDYSRYDRLHVNVSADGLGVDEVMQMISGSGYILTQSSEQHETIKLQIDCPTEEQGWLLTYSGCIPHIGSVTSAVVGTKLLVQVLGPKQWELRYTD